MGKYFNVKEEDGSIIIEGTLDLIIQKTLFEYVEYDVFTLCECLEDKNQDFENVQVFLKGKPSVENSLKALEDYLDSFQDKIFENRTLVEKNFKTILENVEEVDLDEFELAVEMTYLQDTNNNSIVTGTWAEDGGEVWIEFNYNLRIELPDFGKSIEIFDEE